MTIKKFIENLLKPFPGLFRFGSKVYHKFNGSFRSLSPGTTQALQQALEKAVDDQGKQTVGDYYEFGLFRGYTYLQTFKHAEQIGIEGMQFFGFDSFEGLPAPDDENDAHGNHFFEGQFACSKEEVMQNLESNGMPAEKIQLIKGFYEDSLTEELRTQHEFKPAAVVLFDCDYYSSTKVALEWMTPYLRDKTIMLFDDWFSYGESEELGQQKALYEYLEQNPQFSISPLGEFPNNGKTFVLNVSND